MSKNKVVFDVDDTLWGLNDRICASLGIDKSVIHDFNIRKNKSLTDAEKSALLRAYSDVDFFRNIKWFRGIELLNNLFNKGVDVRISSNCMTAYIANVKTEQLLHKLILPQSSIKMNIISSDSSSKEVNDDAFILVDDSPYNIRNSNAKYNILIRQPWNTSLNAYETMTGKTLIYCDTLKEAIELVSELTLSYDSIINYDKIPNC